MNAYMTNDGRFPDDADVLVRYPLTDTQAHGDRNDWPWLHGVIRGQCGENEWHVLVHDELVAEDIDEDAGMATYPLCWRDASELLIRPEVSP